MSDPVSVSARLEIAIEMLSAGSRISKLLYAKLFLPVDDCIGTEEEEGAEGWQILHQFFVE